MTRPTTRPPPATGATAQRAAGDIPSYGTVHPGDKADMPAPDAGTAMRRRVIDRLEACVRAHLIALGRDHERCGKAACARSRRCRGFACEPGVDEE